MAALTLKNFDAGNRGYKKKRPKGIRNKSRLRCSLRNLLVEVERASTNDDILRRKR